MTEPGQTDNYGVAEHLNAIIEHCGKGIVDYCIYDTGEIIPEIIKKYNMDGQDLVEPNIDKLKGIKFLQRNLATVTDGYIRHDANLVAASIIELICDDLKYQDKQNDPQYMMLSNKLREDKRIQKMQKMQKRANKRNNKTKKNKNKKHGTRTKSKFQSKYSDRIQSIKEADKKAKQKRTKTVKKGKQPNQDNRNKIIREKMIKELQNSNLIKNDSNDKN